MNDQALPVELQAEWTRFGPWREQRLARLALLSNWLRQSGFDPSLWQDSLSGLEQRLRQDLVQLAFVAEFSRGKSELINAIFFSGHGQRILPAGAGRTTMCPMELASDPRLPTGLRLLPIETRLDAATLAQWKARHDAWQDHPFAANDAADMSACLARLSDTLAVPIQRAQELGFYLDDAARATIVRTEDGLVEIPRWRHALLNVDHPLLSQGLTILDTPGLNALGAEPELTLSLIPAAQAVVFLLGADTGVTRSDLELWTQHVGEAGRLRSFVVLNKVDTLWDPLLSAAQVQAQIERQRESVASILQIPLHRVFALSARKALLARIQHDPELLEISGVPALEAALSKVADQERRDLIDSGWRATLLDTLMLLERQFQQQIQQADEQRLELAALEGKNKHVVRNLVMRIAMERKEFDAGLAKVRALHAVNARQLEDIAQLLDAQTALAPLAELRQRVKTSVLKTGVRAALEATFAEVRGRIEAAERQLEENRAMLTGACDQLNMEFAFSVPSPKALKLEGIRLELDSMQQDYLRYLTPARWLRLQNTAHAERLLLSALARLRSVLERGVRDTQHWNRAALAQLDVQVRERKRNMNRRMQSLELVEHAEGELGQRIAQLRKQASELRNQRTQLRVHFEGAMR
ncbi:dynamin family protein [Thiomonas sp. FB-Cd]|uniref:dynamin family protein n=1 Tax=Thiomonas sp. FB-Cd TaxID=1158292 RepID=UPI00068CB060|nr:dynamin family protein [Thiomonas sp. FB-Cd]